MADVDGAPAEAAGIVVVPVERVVIQYCGPMGTCGRRGWRLLVSLSLRAMGGLDEVGHRWEPWGSDPRYERCTRCDAVRRVRFVAVQKARRS